jgi:hypothetical protein
MVDRMDVGQYRPGRLSTAEEEAVDGHHHLRVDARRPTAWCRSGPASCGSGSSHGSTSRRAPGVRCLSSQTFYEHRSTPAQPRLWRGTRPPSATLKMPVLSRNEVFRLASAPPRRSVPVRESWSRSVAKLRRRLRLRFKRGVIIDPVQASAQRLEAAVARLWASTAHRAEG